MAAGSTIGLAGQEQESVPFDTHRTAQLRCLVVGAASGIGQATADRLSRNGNAVIRADLPSAQWPGKEGRHPQLSVDIAESPSVHAAVQQAASLLGGLDVVVNTAGILGKVQPSSEETIEEFERLVRINLTGAFALSKAVLPLMVGNGYGRLIHFSSTAGKEGVPSMAGYSASKAGIIGLVKALAKEYATTGVTVNAIAPGKIDTPFISGKAPTPQDLQRIPMGRLGTPAEAAALVDYIASPEASYTTGFVFDLSGGRAVY
ncbi:SDR family oxidoreductase [Paenarthrobacter sp. OM7]|uniref:SDR family NAD(P)-dependent oxidoreductase n=1 Tax=Paenarthrobacter sp. AMU7 TaxID=3162492 RepID=A0AB39YQM4_9MICC|nr:SDR family oxidoreductase [Paenarthrobacter sp. OM7]WGM20474.1 SDR family oxidoreductase [Paenarthrobacter sp. OM7]